MSDVSITTLAERQRAAFRQSESRDVTARITALRVLRKDIQSHESHIRAALKSDLGKSAFEAYASEIAPVLAEIDLTLRHLRTWARPRRVGTPLLMPATSFIRPEPYGAVLIIAPWNYPFQLALIPLVGAIAAGNHVVVKPSEHAPATARIVARILGESFVSSQVSTVLGGIAETQQLLAQQWDYIFYTGSSAVGRLVMSAAAPNLTPVTLELGGKNPCVVTEHADITAAAKRIAWGKSFNAGQTCIAPDFVLAHRRIRPALAKAIAAAWATFYGSDASTSPDYGRIVNRAHFDRLTALLTSERVAVGERADAESLFIAPTLIDDVRWDSALMQDEIFGPILPVIDYDDLNAELARLQMRPKPLAFYLFSSDDSELARAERFPAGAVVLNDTLIHFSNQELPFGGVGHSGMGAYHGHHTFTTFSHQKSVVRRREFPRLLGVRWPPYTLPMWLIKLSLKWFG